MAAQISGSVWAMVVEREYMDGGDWGAVFWPIWAVLGRCAQPLQGP